MHITTLCYIENNGRYLMMHRVKKENDLNEGKWIGIGGHLEEDESPEECIRREALEETGLKLKNLRLRGILTFILPAWGNELTFLYTAECEDDVSFDLENNKFADCNEGVLEWVPIDKIAELPLWEGDRIFLPLLCEREDCFEMKLVYDEEGNLLNYSINE